MKRVVLPALCTVLLLGCNQELPAPTGIKSGTDGAKAASTALATADKFYTDATGDMKIVVRTCDYPATATTGPHCSYCALDQGWVAIGGGAEIEGSPFAGRLRSSFPYPFGINPPVNSPDGLDKNCVGNTPNNDLNKGYITWMGRSDGIAEHRLRTYVVGLQINGLSETVLESARSGNDATTASMNQPTVEATLPGSMAIGGGVDEVGGHNCFLTESRLNQFTNSWRGSAYCSTPGSIKSYVITLNPCLAVPGWDYCMQTFLRSTVSGAVTGYGSASVATPYPWITGSIGGIGYVNSSSSRFLADLIPLAGSNQGVSVTTKDAGAAVSGTTTAFSLNFFGGRFGTWRYNAIRLNSAGGALQRPAGTAPVALMQSTAFPDAPPLRWNMEDIGAGQYRLRNANPSRPASGECAYRQTGTSNVLVGPCGSANEYKWTVIGDPRNTFQLKNVSSATCLDNNNSTSNTALRLAACAAGYAASQAFFLDAYSWPP